MSPFPGHVGSIRVLGRCGSPLRFLAMVVVFVLAFGSFALAGCRDVISVDHSRGFLSRDRSVSYDLTRLWTGYDRSTFIERPQSIAFTKQPGRFLNINCDDRDAWPVERHEMFPIGLLVRPLRVLILDDTSDLSVKQRNELDVLLLVQTEHGHLKVIREEDIQFLISGATYFFAEGNNRIFTCFEASDCPGNQERSIDGAREICNENLCRDYTAIDPSGGYAVGAALSPPGVEQPSPWTRVVRAQARIAEHGVIEADPMTLDERCAPFPVTTFQAGGTPRLTNKVGRRDWLTLCRDRANPEAMPPIKIATKESAADRFETLARGLFFRRFAEGHSIEALLNPARAARLTGVKECGTSLTRMSSVKAGIGTGIRLNAGILNLGAKGAREISSSIASTLASDEYIRFSSYFAPDFDGGALNGVMEGWFLDLIFVVSCDGTVVERPKVVKLTYPNLLDERMEVKAQSLTNHYYKLFSPEEDRSKPLFEWAAPPGHEPNTGADLLRGGHFFMIRDLDTHVRWQATIRDFLWETSLRTYFEGLADTPERQEAAVDFFTHLLMAAIFEYRLG